MPWIDGECLLHVSGDFPFHCPVRSSFRQFSPHTRRCPTRNGLTDRMRTNFLHAHGDVPSRKRAVLGNETFSPRIWRCPATRVCGVFRMKVFSAYAEMSLATSHLEISGRLLSNNMEISLLRVRLNAARFYSLHIRGDISPCIFVLLALHRYGAFNTALLNSPAR